MRKLTLKKKTVFLIKTKNGHNLTFSDKMRLSALLCLATSD